MQYYDEILKVCGIAVICVMLLAVTKTTSSGVTFAVRIGGGMIIFGVLLSMLGDSVEALGYVVSAASDYGGSYLSKAFSLMLKALGIAFVSKLCADVCRDCGEGGIASGVEGVGRMAIFSLCIPVISEIIEYATHMLRM